MYDLKVKNNKGEVLDLTTSNNYTIYKINGLTPPKAVISSSVNATVDGMKVSNVRINSRNIVLYMSIEGEIETNRLALYKYFPPKSTVTLYFKNDSRDVCIDGVVELIECNLFTNKQIAQISIICAEPYFKAVDDLVTVFSDISSLFSFPFSIAESGIELSSITPNLRKSILNVGDISTGVIIELFAVGSVVNPVIYNAFTGEHLKVNYTLKAGEKLVIDTNKGKKAITLVRAGVKINAIGFMSPDSQWLELSSGDNVFTYNADEGTSNLQISFTTSILYGGV